MCGIGGIVGPGAEGRRERLAAMMVCLAHRGPDDAGQWEAEGVCLGHRRLAIIDLSPGGHQPMADGACVLVYNGEIYNYRELRRELAELGVPCRGHSDTEVILKGYRVWGEEVLGKVRGMFALALWDQERRRLWCARDPFGKKPFYYAWESGRLVFASEIEAVVTGLGARPAPNLEDLAHYLWKGYFPPGRTAYMGIYTLSEGGVLEFFPDTGRLRLRNFCRERFSLTQERGLAKTEVLARLEEGLRLAVTRRLVSDVPVGVLLSGGVDSSLVTLLAGEVKPGLVAFTAAFPRSHRDETSFAAQVARAARTQQHEVPVPMESVPELLPRLVAAYGEPFGDYSAIPTYCLFRALKPFAKVVLTGDGGDEVLAGYKDTKLFWWRERLRPLWGLGDLLEPQFPLDLLYRPQKWSRLLGYGLRALKRKGYGAYLALWSHGWSSFWRRICLRPEVWRRLGEEQPEAEEAWRFQEAGSNDLECFLNRYLERLTQDFLVKVDRASMAHGVEARCPFLDIDLFRLVKGLPNRLLLERGVPKSLAKDLLATKMGPAFARRPKVGFTPPLDEWLRQGDTCAWLEAELIHPESLVYSLFRPEGLRELIRRHREGESHTSRLWHLVFLESWHRHFFLGGPGGRTGEISPLLPPLTTLIGEGKVASGEGAREPDPP